MAISRADLGGAIALPPHVLRRIIRRHRKLSGLGLDVVHGQAYTLPRADLLALARPGEVPPEAELPERPILLPSDTPEDRVWRVGFHARVHQAIEARPLRPAVLRERIHRIGQTEFDEIRYVLRSDDLLLPPRDDAETYTEFAALYLELRHFAPQELERTFPTLRDFAVIDALLALDTDAPALLQASRPAGAPEWPMPDVSSPPAALTLRPIVPDPALAAAAEAARHKGNLAHAAVHALGAGNGADARADLERLAARAGLPEPDRAADALLAVARAAASSGRARTPPLRLLYDLQRAAVDLERDTLEINLARWALTLGRRKLVRALPAGREVRHARRLRHASDKLARLRMDGDEVADLQGFLERAAHGAETRARTALRPEIERVLDEVTLEPKNAPEVVAREKLVAELLDQILLRGGFGLGDLRDGLSRNQLKLPDLRDVGELWRGDPLLHADRLFDERLGGVYRGGEVYLRGLQKASSLFFGTKAGRFVTRFLIAPLLAAYVVLVAVGHLVELVWRHLLHHRHDIELYTPLRLVALSIFFFLVLHVPKVRAAVIAVGKFLLRVLAAVFVTAPRALWRSRSLQALLRSRGARLALHYVFKPAVFGLVILFLIHRPEIPDQLEVAIAFASFVAASILANSRLGAHLEEMAGDALVRAGRHFGKRIVPGVIALFLDVFKALLEYLDRAIYAIDEALRFRRGDPRLTLALKAVFGTLWATVAYVIRIVVNLFIEPTVNPIKHFPIVTVAAKIQWSIFPGLLHTFRHALVPYLGRMWAAPVASATFIFLPGFFGFLAWELAGNWRLYAANRRRELAAEPIGHHGETLATYLRVGLHSGTIPKTYAKLRRAVWRGKEGGKHREVLAEIEERISHFVEREFVALLRNAQVPVSLERVEIGSNRVRVELGHTGERAAITFEEQSGWLVAGMAEPGFIVDLAPREAQLFGVALLGLYKRAGVDLIRESIAAHLPDGAPYDVGNEGLVVWDADWTAEIVYPLHPDKDDRWFFSRRPIRWEAWVAFWSNPRLTPGVDPFTLLSR